jgi:predicted anti-sigma-YlaC factor YlaD
VTEYPAGYTCEVIALRLDRYIAGTLARLDAIAVAEHLEACAWCMERLMLLSVGIGNHESGGED